MLVPAAASSRPATPASSLIPPICSQNSLSPWSLQNCPFSPPELLRVPSGALSEAISRYLVVTGFPPSRPTPIRSPSPSQFPPKNNGSERALSFSYPVRFLNTSTSLDLPLVPPVELPFSSNRSCSFPPPLLKYFLRESNFQLPSRLGTFRNIIRLAYLSTFRY